MSGRAKGELAFLSNEELVKLSQSGDEVAKEVLTNRFFYVRSADVPGSYLDSDDFVQEGMIGFLKALDSYDSSKGIPFEAYAFICMRNKIRTATKQELEIPVGDSNDIFENIVDSANPLEKVILNEHLNNVLSHCDETLSETEKAVVFFKAGGLSYEEIGKRLSMSSKSVDNALQRARKKLKDVCQDN